MKKTPIICFLLFFLTPCLAEISFSKNTLGNKKIVQPQKKNKPQKTLKQYDIEGYVNSEYVRFVVNVTNKKIVSGQKIESNGSSYVYGEVLNGVLHLYDINGLHMTVILTN